jgi:hypothetical protein
MSTKFPRSIAKIIEQVGISGHSSLAAQVRQLTVIERQVRACLPADLAEHCQVAGIGDDCLRLATDSPAWAARLRFQGPQLLKQLTHQGLTTLRTVQVRIIPLVAKPTPTSHKPHMGTETARLLEQTAKAIEDPGLAQALRRLARHRAAGPHRR